jgi:hypothetical protein
LDKGRAKGTRCGKQRSFGQSQKTNTEQNQKPKLKPSPNHATEINRTRVEKEREPSEPAQQEIMIDKNNKSNKTEPKVSRTP